MHARGWRLVPGRMRQLALLALLVDGCNAGDDPGDEDAVVACDPLAAEAQTGEVAVEYSGVLEDDRRVLVVRPEAEWDYEDFRVFLGPPDRLLELDVGEVVRAKDGGSTTIELSVDGEPGTLDFPVVSTDDGGFEHGPATLEQGGKRFAIELEVVADPTKFDELEFFCRAGPATGVDAPGAYRPIDQGAYRPIDASPAR